AGANADIVLKTGPVDWEPSFRSLQDSWSFADDDAYLFWHQLGKFRVRGGMEVTIDALPGIDDALIRLPLLGTVLAVLLHQRGLLTLHASAVEINGQAAAFIGTKGAGKSTIAAMLHARGHRLIADDIVAMDLTDPQKPLLLPGFPQFKLW